MSKWPLDQLNENGFAVIENFLSEKETEELKEAALELGEKAPVTDRLVFHSSSRKHYEDKYFLESANKIGYFFEAGAVDENGDLKTNAMQALNKIGHALHLLHPTFKKYTFDQRMQNVAKSIGFRKPAIVQSMLIYKNPKIGSSVNPHQDATYLHTEPIVALKGFWIPTEDATLENGCLHFIKGSHKLGLFKRLVRNPNPKAEEPMIYCGDLPSFSDKDFVACPVKRGSLVILDGLVVHKSEPNHSTKSRLAYTFHIVETDNVKWSEENWIQLPENEQFAQLY